MKNLFLYILPFAGLSMVLGILGGLNRIGYNIPGVPGVAIGQHGVFMVGGFLGTLISLERVATIHRTVLLLIPLAFGLSIPIFLFGYPKVSQILMILGSVGYLLVCLYLYKKHPSEGDLLLSLGAVFQIVGHWALFQTQSYPIAFAAWMLYFLLTIVGERLDLTKFLPIKKYAKTELFGWLILMIIGAGFYHAGGGWGVGISFLGIAQWLLRNDIALINIKKTGHYKFLGLSLIMAFVALAISGVLNLIGHHTPLLYDAILHTFFVGFVLNMILAHAPIIFPALLKIHYKPFHPAFFLWLIFLNVGLYTRIIGDLTENNQLRMAGGLANGLAFLGYLLHVASLIIKNYFNEKNHQVRSL